MVLLVTVWAAGRQSTGPSGDGGTDAARLGPAAGEDVTAYLARARDPAPGAGPRLALVTYDAEVPPSAVVLPTGVTASQVVFRVPLARVQTALRREDVPTTGVADAVAAVQLRAAGEARADAAAAPPGRARDVAAAEAALLAGRCACVLALVVRGDLAALAPLATAPGVRVVEVAPPGASTARLAVSPLLPEQGPGRALGPAVGPVPDDGPVP